MFKVKGTALAIEQIDLFVRRAELMFVEQYRKLIWLTLKELVLTTPQFTGHAAENWNLGIGRPDTTVHDSGKMGKVYDILGGRDSPNEVGDSEAWQKVSARYGGSHTSSFMMGITRHTKVYFTNSVYGDRGPLGNKGATDQVLYLAEYQNPAWHERLREENLPYETAEMVIQRMDVQWRKRPVGKGQKRGLGYGRMAGNSFNAEFA